MLKKLILVLNCGSSSVKFSIFDPFSKKKYVFGNIECLFLKNTRANIVIDSKIYKEKLLDYSDHFYALSFVFNFIKKKFFHFYKNIYGIGHRVVHGGDKINESIIIDEKILKIIKDSVVFAPLHNPANLIGIKIAYKFFPNLKKKNIAVFDTSFHTSIPKKSYLYAIPYKFYKKYKIRRYGAHGISYSYIMLKLENILQKPQKKLNVIICHLGNGSSVTAIQNGKSIDTSMGLTPLEGLVMGTRSGDLDPAIIFFMYNQLGIKIKNIENILTKKSGLLGINGHSSDCRYLEKNYFFHDEAKLAIDIFCHRLLKYIGSYSVLIKGKLDALVFTGGIGENSFLIRKKIISKLSLLGFYIDDDLNISIKKKKTYFINKKSSRDILVIPTKEELFIAMETRRLIENQ
ncbi:acetate kinase [Buchnera aphidicola]|uniref:acetate kinase n=1 Tax=Buchnera aphidicola TaxID=9 RepID=UPI002093D681|nr:acetate kinase [Buchnera aphidicola]USS94253.1 acetate kinase [Buchnera aphidicola (Sipha maydis)]WII23802.1 acetate kinase [Buchnera aphidicola (Sipha maydis)]